MWPVKLANFLLIQSQDHFHGNKRWQQYTKCGWGLVSSRFLPTIHQGHSKKDDISYNYSCVTIIVFIFVISLWDKLISFLLSVRLHFKWV